MTFKSFVMASPQHQYSKKDSEISLWFIYDLVSSLIFGLQIFLFGFPKDQYFTLHKKFPAGLVSYSESSGEF